MRPVPCAVAVGMALAALGANAQTPTTESELRELDDQLAGWRQAHGNLVPGGRFVVDVSMPNLAAYADSFTTEADKHKDAGT